VDAHQRNPCARLPSRKCDLRSQTLSLRSTRSVRNPIASNTPHYGRQTVEAIAKARQSAPLLSICFVVDIDVDTYWHRHGLYSPQRRGCVREIGRRFSRKADNASLDHGEHSATEYCPSI